MIIRIVLIHVLSSFINEHVTLIVRNVGKIQLVPILYILVTLLPFRLFRCYEKMRI